MPRANTINPDDVPELGDEFFANARPAREVLTEHFGAEAVDAMLKRKPGQRGPAAKPRKVATAIRLDADVLDAFRAGGPGWQSRINAALRTAARL